MAERTAMKRAAVSTAQPGGRGPARVGLLPTNDTRHFPLVETVLQGVIDGDEALVHETLEGILHGQHAGGGPRLENGLDLEGLALANQIANGRGGHQQLHGEHDALAVSPVNELLGEDGVEHVGQLDPGLLLLVRGEDVDDAIDALGGCLRVQGRENQVPGLGGGQGRLDGGHVAHFAHEDDIGVLAKSGPEGAGKRQRVDPHLALDDDARPVLEEILDGILESHDVELPLLVHPVQQGGEGGGLALAGGPRDEHEAPLELGQIDHGGGHTDLLGRRNLVGNAAEGRRHGVALLEDVDPEARQAEDAVGEVTVQPLREGFLLILRHDGEDHRLALLGRQVLPLERDQLARDAEHGRKADLEVDVGRIPLDRRAENFLELDHGRDSFRTTLPRRDRPRQLMAWPRSSSRLGRGRARNVATTVGSKWVPAQRSISARAAETGMAREYGRSYVMASKASATAKIRAPSGMSSPRSPSGYPVPSHRSWWW